MIELTETEQELLDERIAIMIYDAGMSEREARIEALKCIERMRNEI